MLFRSLRAPSDLLDILEALGVVGRPLEPLKLVGLTDYVESIEQCRTTVRHATGSYPTLLSLVERIASFKNEAADVRRKIDPSGDVVDSASPALASIRDRLRRQRARLRASLDAVIKGRDTSKYLQEQVVTDRHGRYVLVLRAEHRGAIPGIVHGSSASGASIYVEPMATVEINNDIVALEEDEAEEVRRILLELTDAFRQRPGDLRRSVEVATELDTIQARARFSIRVGGVEPLITTDGSFELREARHPLLILRERRPSEAGNPVSDVVPIDVLLSAPTQVLLITGPNTGGKTVALKTAGLLAAMAQSGLHVPAAEGSRLPVFRSLFADIGDEQSIAASLSTFSAHVTNVVSMDRNLTLPALILLDEIGAGTDPVEGGALGIAVIDHFRQRGAHLIATTHYDALKSYAASTPGVTCAACGFNPDTFAPTYRLTYGTPGRSLAIEIAARLGLPAPVIAAARANLTEEQRLLADHLARMERDVHAIEQDRREITTRRLELADVERKVRTREESVRDREAALRKRLDARIDDQLRDARREIDRVLEDLKTRAPRLVNTGERGAARSDARAAIDRIVGTHTEARPSGGHEAAPGPAVDRDAPIVVGARVLAPPGLEGTVLEIHGKNAEVDVRGKRLRVALRDLQVIGSPQRSSAAVRVNVDLQPREGALSELNVIGTTVDEALDRLAKFLDASTLGDMHTLRIVHGHGTGQLRRAVGRFLDDHPLVASHRLAPQNEGGGGATIVELKD